MNFAGSNIKVDLIERNSARESLRQRSNRDDRFANHRPDVLVLIGDAMLRSLLTGDHVVTDVLGIVHNSPSINAFDLLAFKNIEQ